MINVIIYLEKKNEAKHLVDKLLLEGFIANASIDFDNVSYQIQDGKIVSQVNSVITAQTKTRLFSEIEKYIAENYGNSVTLYSLPITQANHYFDSFIRNHTLKS